MHKCPDHPIIRNMERTGYPDGMELEEIVCPVCGAAAENFYVSAHDGMTVVGCEICVTAIPYYEFAEI